MEFIGVALVLATIAPPKQAEAIVRIHAVARVSEDEWKADQRRTEKLIRDEQGRELLLRLIEFE